MILKFYLLIPYFSGILNLKGDFDWALKKEGKVFSDL
jgi:hypothetical protein